MNLAGMISVASVCFVKLIIAGIPTAAAIDLTFFETFLAAFVGGTAGIIFFVLLIDSIQNLFRRLFPPKKKNKKVFTKKNRLIVKIKNGFGLYGIAFLTPFIFSMPLGAILALRFYNDKIQILRYMIVSVFFWSLFGAWLAEPIKEVIDYVKEIV